LDQFVQQLSLRPRPLEAQRIAPREALCAVSEDPKSETAPDCLLERDGYSVRLANSPDQRSKASTLIQRMYSWRGYDTEAPATLPPNRITLEASSGKHLFGTLTLGLDSEERLLADALYQDEANKFRAMGRRLCEISKLAIDPHYGSKEVLASLFHLAYIYVHIIHKATDVLIEVHPRHAAFYERRLGFRQGGDRRICSRVNAPAVLLHVELSYMDAQISKYGGSRDIRERSLYPYFFSRHEQEHLASRICRPSSRSDTGGKKVAPDLQAGVLPTACFGYAVGS
jgi:hypothetical protein